MDGWDEQKPRRRWRFSFIPTDELPKAVRGILDMDDRVRWRWEGFRGHLLAAPEIEMDRDLAKRLARYALPPEHVASALYQRPSRRQRLPLEDAMILAEEAYFDEEDRQGRLRGPRGRRR